MSVKKKPPTDFERALTAVHNFNKTEVRLAPCVICRASVPTRGFGASLQHQMGPQHAPTCSMFVAHESTCSCPGCKQARDVIAPPKQ
ncbi:MAG TPA: hypothetical protein VFA98_13010 [Thermoanaerobaculia bacterium]|nr:hypothetical protein [Thermoanaerobaculia bacterium]